MAVCPQRETSKPHIAGSNHKVMPTPGAARWPHHVQVHLLWVIGSNGALEHGIQGLVITISAFKVEEGHPVGTKQQKMEGTRK